MFFVLSLPLVTIAEFRAATFEADITSPVGHACMGGGVADAKRIVDPLFAKGFVLLGAGEPIVVAALDWCQCNNDSYDRWRIGLAEAAGTRAERVMLATVHPHDAPICDLTAQRLLDQHGLTNWNCDAVFHDQAAQRTAAALASSLKSSRRVTHLGTGQAKVVQLASDRRVVRPNGKITGNVGAAAAIFSARPKAKLIPGSRRSASGMVTNRCCLGVPTPFTP